MALLDTVKTALRISHSKLDDELTRLIAVARMELQRVGVQEEVAEADSELVDQAIVTYCLLNTTENTALIDRYQRAWELQLDGVRKSSLVNPESDDEESDEDV
jgi:hypothetical protein